MYAHTQVSILMQSRAPVYKNNIIISSAVRGVIRHPVLEERLFRALDSEETILLCFLILCIPIASRYAITILYRRSGRVCVFNGCVGTVMDRALLYIKYSS